MKFGKELAEIEIWLRIGRDQWIQMGQPHLEQTKEGIQWHPKGNQSNPNVIYFHLCKLFYQWKDIKISFGLSLWYHILTMIAEPQDKFSASLFCKDTWTNQRHVNRWTWIVNPERTGEKMCKTGVRKRMARGTTIKVQAFWKPDLGEKRLTT